MWPAGCRRTTRRWANCWSRRLDHITGLGRADTTLYHYRQYVDREIDPVLGSIRLSKLTALDIDRLYTKLRKRGLATATIRQIHAILRASLNQAERWGLVQRNVAKLASAPSQPQREQHPPTIDEVRSLMTASARLNPMLGLYIRVMVATGDVSVRTHHRAGRRCPMESQRGSARTGG